MARILRHICILLNRRSREINLQSGNFPRRFFWPRHQARLCKEKKNEVKVTWAADNTDTQFWAFLFCKCLRRFEVIN